MNTEQIEDTAASGQSALTDGLEALRKLAIREHYYCEDLWYSCPKSDDGCANDANGDECNCGADEHNAEVEKAFSAAMEAANARCKRNE